jgi:hypothetical protein
LAVLGGNLTSLADKCANAAPGALYENPYGLEREQVLDCYGLRWNFQQI